MKMHFPLFFVPQQSVYIVERLGKYHRSLPAGLNLILPFFDKISYIHSLKEQTHQIEAQQAITRDNVFIHIDAVAYLKVTDAYKCSYGAEDPIEYAQTLSKSIMRSEIGKLSLGKGYGQDR
jgi:regulator of protease activity HflC (stomatin/prohibitin superfamily)